MVNSPEPPAANVKAPVTADLKLAAAWLESTKKSLILPKILTPASSNAEATMKKVLNIPIAKFSAVPKPVATFASPANPALASLATGPVLAKEAFIEFIMVLVCAYAIVVLPKLPLTLSRAAICVLRSLLLFIVPLIKAVLAAEAAEAASLPTPFC